MYLKGKSYARRLTRQDMDFALQMYESAVAQDPNFALALGTPGSYGAAIGLQRLPEDAPFQFGAHILGHFQHAHKHGGHPLRMGNLVLLYQAQAFFFIEVIHDHRRATAAQDGHIKAHGRGVVQRRW